jgi:hypothetical protein
LLDWKTLKHFIAPEDSGLPNTLTDLSEELPHEGLTMGSLFIGRQGCGKTTALARHLKDYFVKYPDRAIFVLDWSGSISNEILRLVAQDPDYQSLMRRIVYDEMGHPEYCVTLPEFSYKYDSDYPILNYERQVERVIGNLTKLNKELIEENPTLGGASLKRILTDILRICTSVSNTYGATWQMTEVEKLIGNLDTLQTAIAKYGYNLPTATQMFFNERFSKLSATERELRTYAITHALAPIESSEIKARVGYHKPSWTPREAIAKGQMILVSGQRFKRQRAKLDYLFTEAYSLIMDEVGKRQAADPNDKPVSLVMDEVYSLIDIPGMAFDISQLSPQYRNVKLQLYIVVQELAQFSDELRDHLWSIGNIVCFGLENFHDCYEIAQQLFPYNPEMVKLPAKTDSQHELIEPDRGQYLQIANAINHFPFRRCVIKRYLSEKQKDKYTRWIKETQEVLQGTMYISLEEIKETLLKEHSVPFEYALSVIDARIKSQGVQPKPPPKVKPK